MKIFYFTSTGNSLFAAKKIVEGFNECELLPVAGFQGKNEITFDDEVIGFTFPLYFSGLPKIVNDFIKKADFTNTKYIFAVITAAFPPIGAALSQIKKILKEKGLKLNSGFYLKMADNFIINFEMPAKDKVNKFDEKAKSQIEVITKVIEKKINYNKFEFSFLNKLISEPWLKKVNSLDKNFYSTESCNSCGTCVKVCPVNNISFEKKKPEWNSKCQLCVACVQFCPQKCIHYKDKTEKRINRYINPNIKLNEIIKQKEVVK